MSESLSDQADRPDPTDTTLLFVDDESELLDLWKVMFDGEYDVRTAEGGAAALERLGDQVDLVFLDRRMPEMAGEEVLETVRSQGDKTPVVMVSATSPDEEVSAEYDEYATKPIQREQVHEFVDRYAT